MSCGHGAFHMGLWFWLGCHVSDRPQLRKDLCATLTLFEAFLPVQKVYSPEANASSRFFHSNGECPTLGIAITIAESSSNLR